MAIFSQKITKIAQQLGALIQDPRSQEAGDPAPMPHL